jgi:hypothetical protein
MCKWFIQFKSWRWSGNPTEKVYLGVRHWDISIINVRHVLGNVGRSNRRRETVFPLPEKVQGLEYRMNKTQIVRDHSGLAKPPLLSSCPNNWKDSKTQPDTKFSVVYWLKKDFDTSQRTESDFLRRHNWEKSSFDARASSEKYWVLTRRQCRSAK